MSLAQTRKGIDEMHSRPYAGAGGRDAAGRLHPVLLLTAALLAAFLPAGCEYYGADNGGRDKEPETVTGVWDGTGSYRHNGVAITKFHLDLVQNGNAVSGSYSIKRAVRGEMNGALSGSVSGNRIDLKMHSHGYADGTWSGNSMTLHWTESGFGGPDWEGSRDGTVNLTR